MQLRLRLFISLIVITAIHAGCNERYSHPEYARIIDDIRKPTIEKAERYLDEGPETVTMAYNIPEYIDIYLSLPSDPDHPEVIRNLPVRHPVIWMDME